MFWSFFPTSEDNLLGFVNSLILFPLLLLTSAFISIAATKDRCFGRNRRKMGPEWDREANNGPRFLSRGQTRPRMHVFSLHVYDNAFINICIQNSISRIPTWANGAQGAHLQAGKTSDVFWASSSPVFSSSNSRLYLLLIIYSCIVMSCKPESLKMKWFFF